MSQLSVGVRSLEVSCRNTLILFLDISEKCYLSDGSSLVSMSAVVDHHWKYVSVCSKAYLYEIGFLSYFQTTISRQL